MTALAKPNAAEEISAALRGIGLIGEIAESFCRLRRYRAQDELKRKKVKKENADPIGGISLNPFIKNFNMATRLSSWKPTK